MPSAATLNFLKHMAVCILGPRNFLEATGNSALQQKLYL